MEFETQRRLPSVAASSNPRDYVLSAGGGDGKEHMRVMDGDEVVFDFSSGDARHVAIPQDKYRILADATKKLDVHHNHPIDGVSFSPADLSVFAASRGMNTFYAHTESVSFKIARTQKTAKINRKLIEKLTQEYDRKVAKAFLDGEISIADVENQRPHHLAKRLSSLGYLRYSVEGKLPEAATKIGKFL